MQKENFDFDDAFEYYDKPVQIQSIYVGKSAQRIVTSITPDFLLFVDGSDQNEGYAVIYECALPCDQARAIDKVQMLVWDYSERTQY